MAAKLSSNPKSAAPFRKSQATQTATSTSSASTSSASSAHSRTLTTSSAVDSLPSPTISITSAGPTTTPETTATTTESASASASSSQSSPGGSSSSGLSKGATSGVSVGATLVLLLLAAAVFFFARRTWRKHRGVVVRGSDPPAPSAQCAMALPTSAPYVSRSEYLVQQQVVVPALTETQTPILWSIHRRIRTHRRNRPRHPSTMAKGLSSTSSIGRADRVPSARITAMIWQDHHLFTERIVGMAWALHQRLHSEVSTVARTRSLTTILSAFLSWMEQACRYPSCRLLLRRSHDPLSFIVHTGRHLKRAQGLTEGFQEM